MVGWCCGFQYETANWRKIASPEHIKWSNFDFLEIILIENNDEGEGLIGTSWVEEEVVVDEEDVVLEKIEVKKSVKVDFEEDKFDDDGDGELVIKDGDGEVDIDGLDDEVIDVDDDDLVKYKYCINNDDENTTNNNFFIYKLLNNDDDLYGTNDDINIISSLLLLFSLLLVIFFFFFKFFLSSFLFCSLLFISLLLLEVLVGLKEEVGSFISNFLSSLLK